MDEPNSNQILNYLKGKYLAKNNATKSSKNNASDKKDKLPIGEEGEFSGEEMENKFLKSKLENIQVELSKWLDILKNKL
jgi:hypothetical protein